MLVTVPQYHMKMLCPKTCLMNIESKFHWDQQSAFILALNYGIVLEKGMCEFFSSGSRYKLGYHHLC
jgi:hypothetical protein